MSRGRLVVFSCLATLLVLVSASPALAAAEVTKSAMTMANADWGFSTPNTSFVQATVMLTDVAVHEGQVQTSSEERVAWVTATWGEVRPDGAVVRRVYRASYPAEQCSLDEATGLSHIWGVAPAGVYEWVDLPDGSSSVTQLGSSLNVDLTISGNGEAVSAAGYGGHLEAEVPTNIHVAATKSMGAGVSGSVTSGEGYDLTPYADDGTIDTDVVAGIFWYKAGQVVLP